MHTAWQWVAAFTTAHATVLAFIAYAFLEWWLPRTKFFQANSSLEGLANLAKRLLLDRVPGLGTLIKRLATSKDPPTSPGVPS